jgi:predicted anti-sigma-YlaC factor YlaD
MNILMLSCKKATELIEKKLHFKLSKVESVQLVLHKSMCEACKAYEKQSQLLDKVLSKELSSSDSYPIENITTEFKQNLIKRIKK